MDTAWLILLTPLIAFAVIVFFTFRQQAVSALISVAAVLISFFIVANDFFLRGRSFQSLPHTPFEWLSVGSFRVELGLQFDGLSYLMLLIVTGVGALIHIYSLGYMKDDPGKSRFFAYLSLFTFSMLGIVLSNNFLMTFIFWELVGVSSYLLIGFWYTKPSAAEAAKKAFLVNKIGDFGFLIGILMVWWYSGHGGAERTFNFAELSSRSGFHMLEDSALLVMALLIFCGPMGKSAQFPLHVWLPDAMEGPTPVSALIHAATMVAAGVYLLARVFFIIQIAPQALVIIACIGAVTALMAASIAVFQNDIKRILAYSTLSQLGLMVMGIGLTGTTQAMFHLATHAFFKALLFLGAGSIIHAVHHEQDIWKMGGLAKKIGITFFTFLVGTLAITGMPGLSGFASKEEILILAHNKSQLFFIIGIITSLLTSFYMWRLFFVTFLGKPRSKEADHAHESPAVMWMPLILLTILSVMGGYQFVGIPQLVQGRPLPAHEEGAGMVMAASISVFAVGAILAFLIYGRRSLAEDPLQTGRARGFSSVFANKFYLDEAYLLIVRWVQDLGAKILDFVDKLLLGGLLIRGGAALTRGFGWLVSRAQTGNLQGYSFILAISVIVILYFVMRMQ